MTSDGWTPSFVICQSMKPTPIWHSQAARPANASAPPIAACIGLRSRSMCIRPIVATIAHTMAAADSSVAAIQRSAFAAIEPSCAPSSVCSFGVVTYASSANRGAPIMAAPATILRK